MWESQLCKPSPDEYFYCQQPILWGGIVVDIFSLKWPKLFELAHIACRDKAKKEFEDSQIEALKGLA
jgi:hypothetical protein